jgi:hypothetical protein
MKGMERKAIPNAGVAAPGTLAPAERALDEVDVTGRLVTGDALLTQRRLSRRIVGRGRLPAAGGGESADPAGRDRDGVFPSGPRAALTGSRCRPTRTG